MPVEIIEYIANEMSGKELTRFASVSRRHWWIVEGIYLRRIPKMFGLPATKPVLARLRYLNGGNSINPYGVHRSPDAGAHRSVWTTWSKGTRSTKFNGTTENWSYYEPGDGVLQRIVMKAGQRTESWYIMLGGEEILHRDDGSAKIVESGNTVKEYWYIQGMRVDPHQV